MKKIHILFSISILIILGFLATSDKVEACNNYAFQNDCRWSYSSTYRNDDIYSFDRWNNYNPRPIARYRYNYAFSGSHGNYYPRYAFGSNGY